MHYLHLSFKFCTTSGFLLPDLPGGRPEPVRPPGGQGQQGGEGHGLLQGRRRPLPQQQHRQGLHHFYFSCLPGCRHLGRPRAAGGSRTEEARNGKHCVDKLPQGADPPPLL
jgi:hypothetical protein